MNSTEGIREVVHLVREEVVEEVDDVIHGATFDERRRLVLAAGARLVRRVPDSGRVVDQLETFPDRGGLAYAERCLWQHSEGHLQQLDQRTGFVLRSISPRLRETTGLECIGDDLLVLHAAGRALARVETLDAVSVADVELSEPLQGLAWIARELWSSTADELCRIDPASGRMIARFALPAGVEVCDLAGDAQGRVWCVDGRSRVLRAFAKPRAG
jgi:streptogramin lyase